MSRFLNIVRVVMLTLIVMTMVTGLAEQDIALPIACASLIVMVFYMVGAILGHYLPYMWTCDWAGTHFPTDETSFDGCSSHSKCRKCGEKIMLDGQGNWF